MKINRMIALAVVAGVAAILILMEQFGHLQYRHDLQVEMYKADVVTILHRGPFQYDGLGTGLWLTEDKVLTNCHVAQAVGDRVRLMNSDKDQGWKGTVTHCSKEFDLAIILADYRNTRYIEVKIGDAPKIGAPIYTAGYGRGMPLTMKTGFAGYETDTGWHINSSINPGDSGSPIFNQDQELVGVIFMGMVQPIRTYSNPVYIPVSNSGLAINIDKVKKFLKESKPVVDSSPFTRTSRPAIRRVMK